MPRKRGIGRNPRTGKEVKIPPGRTIRFKPGKDLQNIDNVLIAAAACELHPNAVLKGIELQSTKDRLKEATQEAYDRGVRGVPTVAIRDKIFSGDDRLEEAAEALAS